MFDNNFFEASRNDLNLFTSPILDPFFPDLEVKDEYDSFNLQPEELSNESNINELINNKEKPDKKENEAIFLEIKEQTDLSTLLIKKRNKPDKNNEKIFSIKKQPKKRDYQKLPAYWRFDVAVKYIKTNIVDYGFDELKRLIQESGLPPELKAKKVFLPNSPLFTAVDSMKANFKFFGLTIKEIFSKGKEKEKCTKQQENEKILNEIEEVLKKATFSEANERLMEFMAKTYKELIQDFYRSDKFSEIRETQIAEFHDEGMIKQEDISLLEVDGLIKLIEKKGTH